MPCGRCGSTNIKVIHPKPLWYLAGCKTCGYMRNSFISDDDAFDKLSKWEAKDVSDK